MDKNKTGMLLYIAAFAGLLLLISVKFIRPACGDMVTTAAGMQVPMRCHYTAVCLIYIAVLTIIVNIAGAVIRQYLLSGIMDIVLAVLAFMSTNGTLGMGLCMKPEMPCHSMAAFAKLIAIVIGVLGILIAVKRPADKQ